MHQISAGDWDCTPLELFILIMITNRPSELGEKMSF